MITIKTLWMMITGLFKRSDFEDKEDFRSWYWERIPDERYPGESVADVWDTFLYCITLKSLWWDVRMFFERHFNKKNWGYSWTFEKNGYFIMNNEWFVPSDKSFDYGRICYRTEHDNGNPYFEK
jgi:hypothetical protein